MFGDKADTVLGEWGTMLLGGDDGRSITHHCGTFKTPQALVKIIRTSSIVFGASAEYFGVMGKDEVRNTPTRRVSKVIDGP